MTRFSSTFSETCQRMRKRSVSEALRSTSGAIDLASIMVGVLVIGIIGGVISATVFAVIPWSQDEAAKANLSAVSTAEETSYVYKDPNVYFAYDSHPDSVYRAAEVGDIGIQRPAERLIIETSPSSQFWIAAQKSATGKVFYRTGGKPDVFTIVPGNVTPGDLAPTADPNAPGIIPANVIEMLPPEITVNDIRELLDDIITGDSHDFGLTQKPGFGPGLSNTGGVSSPATPAGTAFTSLSSTINGTFALDGAGNTWNWGGAFAVPTKLSTVPFTKIVSSTHNVAIDANGDLWTWGYNDSGERGDADPAFRDTPQKITSGTTFTDVAVGGQFSIALDSTGKIWTWGNDAKGQLGNGAVTGNVSTPTQLTTDSTFSDVAAGGQNSYALDSAGALWSWGGQADGAAGNGLIVSWANIDSPFKIAGSDTFTAVESSADSNAAIALHTNKQIFTWGGNNWGVLGTGNVEPSPSPTAIAGGQLFNQISIGGMNTGAVDVDGDIWFWGYGYTTTPVEYPQTAKFSVIAASKGFFAALDTSGGLWTWGQEAGPGYLGNGTYYQPVNDPTLIPQSLYVG